MNTFARGWLATVAALALLVSPGCGETSEATAAPGVAVGRNDLLRNVHGYDRDGTTMVPVRLVCEWLGASVAYEEGSITVSYGGRRIRLRVGSAVAVIDGEPIPLPLPVMTFSGVACAPVVHIASALGADVRWDPGWGFGHVTTDAGWDSNPRVVLTRGNLRGVILLHQEPPDVVQNIIRDLENSRQTDLSAGFEIDLGVYGVDWILPIKRIHRGSYFESSSPAIWQRLSGQAPQFLSGAAGLYGLRDGKWRFLMGMQDTPSNVELERIGLPRVVAREMGLVSDSGIAPPVPTWPPPPGAPPGPPAPPPITHRLTPESGRFAYIGDDYFVSALNFRRRFESLDRGVKILGEITTPIFQPTTKPVHVELSLMAYDTHGGMLGSATISLRDIPDSGATVPFEVTLFDVSLSELGYVRIVPKGAWTYGRD